VSSKGFIVSEVSSHSEQAKQAPSIVRILGGRRVERVAGVERNRNAYRFLLGKPLGTRR